MTAVENVRGEDIRVDSGRPPKPSGPTGLGAVWRAVRSAPATARNVAEVVRFGGLETDEEPSPFDVVAEQRTYRLRRYFADEPQSGRPPILLVPPLMITAEIWDVSPGTSAVAHLHEAGIDPWVVDFGHPDREPGGLRRTLTDHVVAVADAVERVRDATGRDVVLGGYSQGGMFVYQAAAYLRGKGVDSLITFGSPVDTRAPLPIPVSPEFAAQVAGKFVDSGLAAKVFVPGWAARLGFKMLAPAKSVRSQLKFLMALHDREALLPRERQRRFLDSEGWTAWSGPAIAELLEQFFTQNRMLEGGFTIGEHLVTLADLDCPVFTVVGEVDTIGNPEGVRAIRRAAPKAEVYELALHAGHFGLVVGSTATAHTWPAVASWVNWRHGHGQLPDVVTRIDPSTPDTAKPAKVVGSRAQLATDLGRGASKLLAGTGSQAARAAQIFVRESSAQLPRLARLDQIHPNTRISLGLLLDEQARKAPDNICFLFGDRAHRQTEVKNRVDSVVKGLVHVGIRHGDRVGVLMSTRPSAFTVVAAINRLGATAVLLRPDGDLAREARLGLITWLISDPEHAQRPSESGSIEGVTWCVLGGGAGPRDLGPDVVDMEQIDPDEVTLPGWYRANPHRAEDVAFVVFTGDGEGTRAVPITSRRWALSALGTASAASLRAGDTVYSVTPIHHSSALLMSVGGAIAGGARFAMATAEDPDTFWDEVRRYGVTHVSYTWSSLRAIVDAPAHTSEQHHPIRLFIGSGMPRNLWRRVSERFAPARVLEFYASAGGETILTNLTGSKPGSMGQPLPGAAEVRLASYNLTERRMVLGPDGLARECEPDELGLLLARVRSGQSSATGVPMRGVFSPDDAWQSTDDLFRRDAQGDYWLVDAASSLIVTPDGVVPPSIVRNALGTIPAIDLAVVYGVEADEGVTIVAAVSLRNEAELSGSELDSALGALAPTWRPSHVQVLDDLPLTTWHRPLWRPLQAAGIPAAGKGRVVWRLDEQSGHYEQRS